MENRGKLKDRYLVGLVCLVCLVKPDRPEQPDEPDKPPWFFRSLLNPRICSTACENATALLGK
jgi:hypothetical protein